MLKLGIVTEEGLARPRTLLGKKRHASLLLLRTMHDGRRQDTRRYDSVISYVLTANGTWKETDGDRFAELDRRTAAILAAERPAGDRLVVLDLAASSGATSVRLLRALEETFTVELVASDLWRDAFAVRDARGRTVVLDRDGNELQYVLGPFVLQGQQHESPFYPVNHLLRAWARRRLLPAARAALARVDRGAMADFAVERTGDVEITKVPLLAWEAVQASRAPDFRFEVMDVFEPLPYRADVVRAMNVLTHVYFDDARLRVGIRRCLDATAPRGLLILGRSPSNDPRDLRATIYRRELDGHLTPLERFNGGYEREDLVDAEATAAAPASNGAGPS